MESQHTHLNNTLEEVCGKVDRLAVAVDPNQTREALEANVCAAESALAGVRDKTRQTDALLNQAVELRRASMELSGDAAPLLERLSQLEKQQAQMEKQQAQILELLQTRNSGCCTIM